MRRQVTYATTDTSPCGGRRVVVAELLLFTLLVAAACGVNPIHEPPPLLPTATATELPLPAAQPDRSALYYLVSDDPLKGTVAGALALSDGSVLWRTPVVQGLTHTAAIGGGIVYIGEGSQGRLLPDQFPMEALSEANGALLWQSRFPATAVAPLAENGDLVFVQVDGLIPPPTPVPSPNSEPTPAPPPPPNAILALRAGQSAPLWRLDVPGDILPWATADDSTLYAIVSGLDPSAPLFGDLTAIDTVDGHVRWQLPLQSPPPSYSVPVESDGVLYFSEQYCACRTLIPSTMLAVRASDGKVLWQKTAPDGVVTAGTVVTGGMVSYDFVRANNDPGGGIIALRAADGSPGWQVSWPSAVPDGFAGGEGVLYAATVAPSGQWGQLAVAAFDAQTGAQLFDLPVPQLPVQLDSPPGQGAFQEAGGTLYFVSPGNPIATGATAQLVSVVLALRASDGSLKWARRLDGDVEPSIFVVP
jgi:outer membrane protein assembly factor BamB